MRIIKNILKILIVILILGFIAGLLYWNHLKPTYSGNLKIENLQEKVDVYFDDIGVPHIYAENQEDAYVTLGYLHAQDRLWQMELVRRIAAGRLSEILGKDLLKIDKFFLGMGIPEAADRTIKNLDVNSKSYKLTEAYLKGINQFIDNGPTPIEFRLVGVTKENFTIKDIYNVFGYMSFSFAMAHKTDPLMSSLSQKLDAKYLLDLGIHTTPNTVAIPVYNVDEGIQSNMVASISTIMDNLPVSPFIGSNAWVIGPEKSAKGKVIFANDPHIAYSQPATWYQSHIVCPDFEIYGFNLALTPFPLLGHNRNYAYGLTMFENDDIDFYEETLNPNNANEYLTATGYETFETLTKKIKIKGLPDEEITIKIGKHGPVMNDFIDLIDSPNPIAMDWVYTKFHNKMLMASYEMSHSNSLSDFKEGVSKIHAPGLNVMYGDADDNIAWFAAGKLYRHANGVNPKFILDGSNGSDDELVFMDFKDNPQAINPAWNYVYSANNQPDSIKGGLYPGYYLPENRAKRITDVLTNLTNLSQEDMEDLITDVTSSVVPDLIKIIVSNLDESELTADEKSSLRILRSWNASYDLNQVAPTIFTKFKHQFLKNVFEDELGEKGFNQLLDTHIMKRQFNKQIKAEESIWNDNVKSLHLVEDKKSIIVKSFKETISFLKEQHGDYINNWTWDKVHTVEHEHLIGKKPSFLKKYFNVGPFPINGSNEVLNNQIFDLTGKGVYKVTAGPSTRRIVDFNDIDNSKAILPTGQSGNVFSKHYKDQAEKFVNGEFVKMLLNKEEIQQSKDKLVISPK